MCDPITIASAALTLGSTVANASANNSAAQARNDALAAERTRQQGFDQETQALNATAQDRFTGFEEKRTEKSAALGDYLVAPEASAANVSAASVMPTATNDIVTRETAKKSGEARAFTDQQAGSLAELRAFGDVLGDTSLMQARDASALGQIGGFKRGSTNVVPVELDAASQKGAGMKLLGDILGGAGSIGMTAGISGATLPGFGGSKPLTAVGRTGPVARAGTVVPARAAPASYDRFSGVY